MIRIQYQNNTVTVESAGDVLEFIRKYISVAHPVTINTFDDAEGTLIIVADAGTKPTANTGRKK